MTATQYLAKTFLILACAISATSAFHVESMILVIGNVMVALTLLLSALSIQEKS